jgi:hypothetical protein
MFSEWMLNRGYLLDPLDFEDEEDEEEDEDASDDK